MSTSEMAEIDAAFRAQSGLDDRRFYKIFYSHVHRFPLLVLGQNPGGETDGTDLVASDTFFENWEHDFVRFRDDSRYALAAPMHQLLSHTLGTHSDDALRQIPVSNVIFRRSRDTKSLDLSPSRAASESAPFLSRILEIVQPTTILLISKTAYDRFKRNHCDPASVQEDPEPRIYTPNGARPAQIFMSATASVPAIGRPVSLFVVGHPSKYGRRAEWSAVLDATSQGFARVGLRPLAETGSIRDLDTLDP